MTQLFAERSADAVDWMVKVAEARCERRRLATVWTWLAAVRSTWQQQEPIRPETAAALSTGINSLKKLAGTPVQAALIAPHAEEMWGGGDDDVEGGESSTRQRAPRGINGHEASGGDGIETERCGDQQ